MRSTERIDYVSKWLDLLPEEACECIASHLTAGRPTRAAQYLASLSHRQSRAIWNTLTVPIIVYHRGYDFPNADPDENLDSAAAYRWVSIYPKKNIHLAIYADSSRYSFDHDDEIYDFDEIFRRTYARTVIFYEANTTFKTFLLGYKIREVHINAKKWLPNYIDCAKLRAAPDGQNNPKSLMYSLALACHDCDLEVYNTTWELYAQFPRCVYLSVNQDPPFFFIPKLCKAESLEVKDMRAVTIARFRTSVQGILYPSITWAEREIEILKPCTALQKVEVSVELTAAASLREFVAGLPHLNELALKWIYPESEEEEERQFEPGTMLSIVKAASHLTTLKLPWNDEGSVAADIWKTSEWSQILESMGPRLHTLEHESKLQGTEYWDLMENMLVCLLQHCPNVRRLALENRKVREVQWEDAEEDEPDWKQLDRISAAIRVLRTRRRGVHIEGLTRTIDLLAEPE